MQGQSDGRICANYGVELRDVGGNDIELASEAIRRLGFAVIDSGFSHAEILQISDVFDRVRQRYQATYGFDQLSRIDEAHTLRAPLAMGDPLFIRIASDSRILELVASLINGKFILSQQNGVINPILSGYSQARWHRDLPYQHYVSNTPLAINALYCVDDFTATNGATLVLPGTHKTVSFPSDAWISRNSHQIEARAGQYVVLDSMLFHSGGVNTSNRERRAVNNLYTIPYFKQQVSLPAILMDLVLTKEQRFLFGFDYEEPQSLEEFFTRRMRRFSALESISWHAQRTRE